MWTPVRWVLSRKMKNGDNIIETRLCTRVLEELKDRLTQTPLVPQELVIGTFLVQEPQINGTDMQLI